MSLTIHYKYQTFVNVRSHARVQASVRALRRPSSLNNEYAIHELACCTRNNFISVFVLVEQLVELFFATAKLYFLALRGSVGR